MNRYWLLCGFLLYQSVLWAQAADADSPIGYATIEDAFIALEADPAAAKTEYEGWTIFNQKGDGKYILWSFTPQDHPAHPSVIRRDIVKKDDELFISMNALCHSSRFDCDQLIEQFEQINERIRQSQSTGS